MNWFLSYRHQYQIEEQIIRGYVDHNINVAKKMLQWKTNEQETFADLMKAVSVIGPESKTYVHQIEQIGQIEI